MNTDLLHEGAGTDPYRESSLRQILTLP
jgi:hypothetical protein